jgi:hypothetical protein
MSEIKGENVHKESYWDKHGIPQTSLKGFGEQLRMTVKLGQRRGVLCGISEAGEGKSQIVHSIAKEFGYRVVDIRTAQYSLIGTGVPQRADEETGLFDIALPSSFPQPGEKCIILFDEINQGQAHAIAMFFQLLEDRRLYSYELSDEVIIVALMNPSAGGYVVTKLESNPAMNRSIQKFWLRNNYMDWVEYAKTPAFHETDGLAKPCHPWILRFLETDNSALYASADRNNGKQFACPATWQTVSLSMYNAQAMKWELTDQRTEDRIAASINPVMAHSLVEYIRNNAIRINPREVLKDYKKGSDIRKRILQLKDAPGGDYLDLAQACHNYIFSEKPKVEEIAPQWALFWADMPVEAAQANFGFLRAAANLGQDKDGVNIDYLKALTEKLQERPEYIAMLDNIEASAKTYESALKGEGEAPDAPEDADEAANPGPIPPSST